MPDPVRCGGREPDWGDEPGRDVPGRGALLPVPDGRGAPVLEGRGAEPDGRGAPVPEGRGAPEPDGRGAPVPEGRGALEPDGRGAPVPEGRGAELPEGRDASVLEPAGRGAAGRGAEDGVAGFDEVGAPAVRGLAAAAPVVSAGFFSGLSLSTWGASPVGVNSSAIPSSLQQTVAHEQVTRGNTARRGEQTTVQSERCSGVFHARSA